MYQGCQ